MKLGGAVAGGLAGMVTKMVVIDKMVRAEMEREDSGDGGGDDGQVLSFEVATLLKRMQGDLIIRPIILRIFLIPPTPLLTTAHPLGRWTAP